MSEPELSDLETRVLGAVHAEGSVDLYDLARIIGTGPRSVQEVVRSLSKKRLVIVSANGVEVHCTPKGQELARARR